METLKDTSIIIGFKNPPGKSDIEFVTNIGGRIKRVYRIINAISAAVPGEVIDTIKKNPGVEYVEIDEKVFAHSRVPIGTCQEIKITKKIVPWGINRIGSRLVNSIGNTGKDVKIAILDTGIDKDHENLRNNIKGGYNFVDNNSDWGSDLNGHGTHVAGIVAAEDIDIGVVGVAPDAYIYSVKVLDYAATGTASDIIAGVEWSVENDMQMINMSLGSDQNSISFKRSMTNAYNSGMVIVAAAGNSGNIMGNGDTMDYPSRYYDVISVGATDINDKRARFSSTGPLLEICAPGVDISSTLPGNKYGILSGTSMSSPHVTGVAALVKNKYLGMTNTEIRVRLQVTAQNIAKNGFLAKKDWYGYGLVDAAKAIEI